MTLDRLYSHHIKTKYPGCKLYDHVTVREKLSPGLLRALEKSKSIYASGSPTTHWGIRHLPKGVVISIALDHKRWWMHFIIKEE
jgi:hypothetical protein